MKLARFFPAIALAGLLAAACGGGTSGGGGSSPSATVPSDLTVDSFDVNFTAMAKLTSLHSAGSGLVGVLLPDTTSSVRYVNFDAPYLTTAFTKAGYSSSEFK